MGKANNISTKEQERAAVNEINKIVEALGPDSYVGAAMDGVLKMATSNIDNDFFESWSGKYDYLQREYDELEETAIRDKKAKDKAEEDRRIMFKIVAEKQEYITRLEVAAQEQSAAMEKTEEALIKTADKVSELVDEITQLKAKLYDANETIDQLRKEAKDASN